VYEGHFSTFVFGLSAINSNLLKKLRAWEWYVLDCKPVKARVKIPPIVRAKRYLVRGRVQGVGYRYFAQGVAERMGVRGYVRNLPSGDVEVHAQADGVTLAAFKQELERGPRMSRVTEVVESEAPVSETYSSFFIRG